MAYNQALAERIWQALEGYDDVEEKKMMGGVTFMVNGKMCVGIIKDELMCRIDPDIYEEALNRKGCREMDMMKKPMTGYVLVNEDGIGTAKGLQNWVNLALEYNKKAKASKKKKK